LAIVKRLAELLGYAVRIDSRVGKGSRFTVSIPRAHGVFAPAAASSARAGLSDLADHFVVVVDDDSGAREGLRALLKSWRCRVLAGASLAELEQGLRARGEQPDVIVSDYRLRDDSNGVALINALRARYGSTLPGVVLTGDLRQAHAVDSGAPIEWLQKPVAPERLHATLARVLQLSVKQT
jgi:two-component system, sensor histidine kinase